MVNVVAINLKCPLILENSDEAASRIVEFCRLSAGEIVLNSSKVVSFSSEKSKAYDFNGVVSDLHKHCIFFRLLSCVRLKLMEFNKLVLNRTLNFSD